MVKDQPAKVSYFFGKGYTDLGNTIKEAWSLNIESAKNQLAIAGESGYFSFGGGIHLVAPSVYSFLVALLPLLHLWLMYWFCLSFLLWFTLDLECCGLWIEFI